MFSMLVSKTPYLLVFRFLLLILTVLTTKYTSTAPLTTISTVRARWVIGLSPGLGLTARLPPAESSSRAFPPESSAASPARGLLPLPPSAPRGPAASAGARPGDPAAVGPGRRGGEVPGAAGPGAAARSSEAQAPPGPGGGGGSSSSSGWGGADPGLSPACAGRWVGGRAGGLWPGRGGGGRPHFLCFSSLSLLLALLSVWLLGLLLRYILSMALRASVR